MNDEQKKGIQDLPLPGEFGEDGKFKGDALGIGQYADALSEFISECDTPITIAISGPWGSGKTSVMNMVQGKLKDKIVPILFNCWQFSQFNLSANLSGVMVNFFVDEICKTMPDKNEWEKLGDSGRKIFTSCKWILGTTLKAAASIGGIKADQAIDALISTIDSVQSAKNNMEKMVQNRLDKEPGKKVVIFIDDLDRLVPSVALDLLEVMKIFLDVKGCVFVIACDFDVVNKGVAAKFKTKESEISGRFFFDKLIQLSFNMPVGAYNIRTYLDDLLKQIGFECDDEDLDIYYDLLKVSIGFNPRGLKILANSLILMNRMRLNQDIVNQTSLEKKKAEKIIFALTCMERAYPQLYHLFMTRLNDKPIKFLTKELDSSQKILDTEALQPFLAEALNKETTANKIREFMRYFFSVLDTDSDESLSYEELTNLKKIVALSSLTARGTQQVKTEDQDFSNDQITELCRKVYEELSRLGLGSKFPNGHSRKANDSLGIRSYLMWFKPEKAKLAWGNWKIFYEIKLEPKADNSRSLSLSANKTTDVDKARIEALNNLPIVKDGSYEFYEDEVFARITRKFGPFEVTTKDGDINTTGIKQIAQDLKELIEATHDHFNI